MPRIPWNPRNYSYGTGSNYGPVALNMLQNGTAYIGEDNLVHPINKINKQNIDTNKMY